jgi:hypothetical protein
MESKTVQEIETDQPGLYGFRILGEVDREDMRAMSERMLKAFDAHDKVDMLLVFETDKTSTPDSSWSTDALKAQFKSLSKVRNYVVANAPGQAGGIVEAVGKLMPVEARSFDTEEDARAWLREQPPLAA